MKKYLTTLLAWSTLGAVALAHGDVELGPNGGRVLQFSKSDSLRCELSVKDGSFHVALLDKEMRPVPVVEQELTATSGDRAKPEKLAVEKKGGAFVLPAVKSGEWVIFQFRESAKAKPVTARMQYDLSICGGCKEPEWICKCASKGDKGKK